MRFLRQSTAVVVSVGPFVDVTDAATPEVGILIASTVDEASILKHGAGAKVDVSGGTWVHISGGVYNFSFTSGWTDTAGTLRLWIQEVATCRPVTEDFMVLPQVIYDFLLASGILPAATVADIVDQTWDEDVATAHGTLGTAGRALRAVGVDIAARAIGETTLNGLLGVPDLASYDIAHTICDEVVDGSSHTVADSLGRRIRQIDDLLASGGSGDIAAIKAQADKIDLSATAGPAADSLVDKLTNVSREVIIVTNISGTTLRVETALEAYGLIDTTTTTAQAQFYNQAGGLIHTITTVQFGAANVRGFFTYDWTPHVLVAGQVYQVTVTIDGSVVATKVLKVFAG